jgi:fluoroquinolone transport system permease protein
MPMTRLRQAALLLGPTARTLRWAALPAILLPALGLVELQRRQPNPDLTTLRVGALLLAVWAGFALDDPAEATVAAAPLPLLGRRALRVLAAVVALGACWALLLASTPNPLPAAGVTLEAAALVAVALAAAAVASRLVADRLGGLVAGPVVLGLTLAAIRLPRRLWLYPAPGDPGWTAAHGRWAAVVAVAVVVLMVASLDPGRRGPRAFAVRLLAGRPAGRHEHRQPGRAGEHNHAPVPVPSSGGPSMHRNQEMGRPCGADPAAPVNRPSAQEADKEHDMNQQRAHHGTAAFQPLRPGEILSAALAVYRRSWRTLLAIAAVSAVPLAATLNLKVQCHRGGSYQLTSFDQVVLVTPSSWWGATAAGVLLVIVGQLVVSLVAGPILSATATGLAGTAPSVGRSFRFGFARFGSLLPPAHSGLGECFAPTHAPRWSPWHCGPV